MPRTTVGAWSIVRIRSAGPAEPATMSALVDMTDNSRDNDTISPVGSEAGNSLRQTKFLQIHCPFQERTLWRKLCSAATCSAMSDMAQSKKCWKTAWIGNNLRTDLTHQSQLTKWNSQSATLHRNQSRRDWLGGRLRSSA